MSTSRKLAAPVLACLAIITATGAFGQSYPAKPIRLLTGGAGGSSDTAARLIAPGITGHLGQQVIVDNRPGVISVEVVAKAPADGYTLLMYGSVVWLEPLIRSDVAWDPIRDLAPVTMVNSAPNILTVHPSLPAKSVPALIALAKARPGELNYASVGTGSSTHLAAELFNYMAKVKVARVPYKAAVGALSDLLSGQVQLIFASPFSVSEYLKSGRLKALAVTTAEPSPLAPGLPTVAASGVPGYEAGTMVGVFAPAKTPEAYINRLNQDIVRVLRQPEVKERFFKSGVEVVAGSPEQTAATIRSETERLGRVIKAANIRAE